MMFIFDRVEKKPSFSVSLKLRIVWLRVKIRDRVSNLYLKKLTSFTVTMTFTTAVCAAVNSHVPIVTLTSTVLGVANSIPVTVNTVFVHQKPMAKAFKK